MCGQVVVAVAVVEGQNDRLRRAREVGEFGQEGEAPAIPGQEAQLLLELLGRDAELVEPGARPTRPDHVVHQDARMAMVHRRPPPGVAERKRGGQGRDRGGQADDGDDGERHGVACPSSA